MKPKLIIVSLLLIFSGVTAEAQLLKKLKKRVAKAAEEAIIRKTEDKVAKETGKVMDTILDGKKGKKDNKSKQPSTKQVNKQPQTSQQQVENPELKPWSKYNFVPGDKIIFHDDLSGEESGEFPSRWDIIKGSGENALFEGENVINLTNKSIITPLMDANEYLPEVFTIEFDAYFDYEPMGSGSWAYHQIYKLRFWNGNSYITLPNKAGAYDPLSVYRYGATLSGKINGQRRDYKGFEKSMDTKEPMWRHIAIAFNKRSLKIFVDQYRALNIPNLGFLPKTFSIEGYSHTHLKKEGFVIAIKNIRIAKGGKKLYDRVIADGKFVTRGILFDTNQATIKPESMGVLNKVAKMMKEHQDLNFSIEGHTDSDGADDYNLQLSAQRADAVKRALISLGIDSRRFKTTGKGESVPVAENTTPEGKANNRRVEFIKI